jgi:hypothetical protein
MQSAAAFHKMRQSCRISVTSIRQNPYPKLFLGISIMRLSALLLIALSIAAAGALKAAEPLKLKWEKNILTISGDHLAGGEITINYLEAYCRDGSTEADWGRHTVVGHSTRLVETNAEKTMLRLEDKVNDGVIVSHVIRSTHDEVRFEITAHNPTGKRSEAHWAQPCIRLAKFTGGDQQTYLAKSFIFLDGQLARFPTRDWATKARYTPGQVWCPAHVNRNDVNPRPLSPLVPSNGLIGCFSADEKQVFGTAFEPYQELFQGVIVCLHSDFRLGGLKPGENLKIKGRIYIAPDVENLLKRYNADFPEQNPKAILSKSKK